MSSATSQMLSRLWMKRALKEPLEREPHTIVTHHLSGTPIVANNATSLFRTSGPSSSNSYDPSVITAQKPSIGRRMHSTPTQPSKLHRRLHQAHRVRVPRTEGHRRLRLRALTAPHRHHHRHRVVRGYCGAGC